MEAETDHITVYSDYVCPFCYLGRQSLETYQDRRDQELTIDWHPFDLRRHKRGPDGEIDHSVDDGKDDAYFDQVRQNVTRLQAKYDAEEMLSLDDLPEDVDSFDAQVASFYVSEEYPDSWLGFHEGIYDALWVDGRDIGDIEVIVDIAEAVALPGDEIREAVEDSDHSDRLREKFAEAQTEGITGVPTFIYEGYGARGAVPPDQLERLVEGP